MCSREVRLALLVSNVPWPSEDGDPIPAILIRLGVSREHLTDWFLIKKSLDARHGRLTQVAKNTSKTNVPGREGFVQICGHVGSCESRHWHGNLPEKESQATSALCNTHQINARFDVITLRKIVQEQAGRTVTSASAVPATNSRLITRDT